MSKVAKLVMEIRLPSIRSAEVGPPRPTSVFYDDLEDDQTHPAASDETDSRSTFYYDYRDSDEDLPAGHGQEGGAIKASQEMVEMRPCGRIPDSVAASPPAVAVPPITKILRVVCQPIPEEDNEEDTCQGPAAGEAGQANHVDRQD